MITIPDTSGFKLTTTHAHAVRHIKTIYVWFLCALSDLMYELPVRVSKNSARG